MLILHASFRNQRVVKVNITRRKYFPSSPIAAQTWAGGN
jgi:hypothetical protein